MAFNTIDLSIVKHRYSPPWNCLRRVGSCTQASTSILSWFCYSSLAPGWKEALWELSAHIMRGDNFNKCCFGRMGKIGWELEDFKALLGNLKHYIGIIYKTIIVLYHSHHCTYILENALGWPSSNSILEFSPLTRSLLAPNLKSLMKIVFKLGILLSLVTWQLSQYGDAYGDIVAIILSSAKSND